jgi:hypothetical protein
MIARIKFSRCNAHVLLAGVLLTITPFLTQAQQSVEWKSVIVPDHSFMAEMPGVPNYSEQPLKSPGGTAYTMHSYLLVQGNVAYVITTAVYPTDVDVSSPKGNLQAGLDNAAKKMNGEKWTSISWVEHQGLVAVDAVGAGGELEVRSYSVMKGSQIVTLTYVGPPGSTRTPNVDRFVNSLQIPK